MPPCYFSCTFSIEALLTRTLTLDALTRLVTAYCSLTLTLRSNAPDGAGLTRYSVCYCYSTIELNDRTRRTPCSLVVALFVMRHASCCLWTMREGTLPGHGDSRAPRVLCGRPVLRSCAQRVLLRSAFGRSPTFSLGEMKIKIMKIMNPPRHAVSSPKWLSIEFIDSRSALSEAIFCTPHG